MVTSSPSSSDRSFDLLHISDLHFGRVQNEILHSLENFLTNLLNPPHLIILTGDLTQRARKEQFLEAKSFLEKLPCPVFLVPGNHDVPLYNLFLRFFQPYKKFRKYMKPWADLFYEDDHVAVCGLWTVDNFKIEEGLIPSDHLKLAEAKFKSVAPHKTKILAFHHPVLKSQKLQHKKLQSQLLEIEADILMWGHDHQSGAKYWAEAEKKFPLLVAAGTTISSRTRHEANSFNWLKINPHQVEVATYVFNEKLKQFEVRSSEIFQKQRI